MPEYHLHLPIPHKGQLAGLTDRRFTMLRWGRRTGKSELMKLLLIEAALPGYPVAWFAPSYKYLRQIFKEVKASVAPITKRVNNSEFVIELYGGGLIEFFSLHANPDAARGRKYKLVALDEAALIDEMEEAWTDAISPTLIDMKGRAVFGYTPKGRNSTIFKMEERALNDANWHVSHATTHANPFIPPDEIERLQLEMHPLSFQQEILAEYVDKTALPFAYNFDRQKHVSTTIYNSSLPLYLSFDFNVNPMTAIAGQHVVSGHQQYFNVLREFRLANSSIEELCKQIVRVFHRANFIVTGDASGMARSALLAEGRTAYRLVQQGLDITTHQLKVPSKNPAIALSQIHVNRMLALFEVNIDPSCTYLIQDLLYCEMNEKNEIDKAKDKHRTHLLDCFRYYTNTFISPTLVT